MEKPLPHSMTNTVSTCPECKAMGSSVGLKTLRHLLKEEILRYVRQERDYYFCVHPSCEIVYFSKGFSFTKVDVKVRVGLKEEEPPIPVCYCFGITKEDIVREIREKGFSNASERIKKEIESGNCSCEIKNPSGRCCLGDVVKVEKEIMAHLKRKG